MLASRCVYQRDLVTMYCIKLMTKEAGNWSLLLLLPTQSGPRLDSSPRDPHVTQIFDPVPELACHNMPMLRYPRIDKVPKHEYRFHIWPCYSFHKDTYSVHTQLSGTQQTIPIPRNSETCAPWAIPYCFQMGSRIVYSEGTGFGSCIDPRLHIVSSKGQRTCHFASLCAYL